MKSIILLIPLLFWGIIDALAQPRVDIKGGFIEDYYSELPPTSDYALRAAYYTNGASVADFPNAITARIYRKRDNQFLQSVSMVRQRAFERFPSKYAPLCPNEDTTVVVTITYFGFPKISSEAKNERLYIITDPLCCREVTENMDNRDSPTVLYMEVAPLSQLDYSKTYKSRSPIFDLIYTLKACKDANTAFNAATWRLTPNNITRTVHSFSEPFTKNNPLPYNIQPFKNGFSANAFMGSGGSFSINSNGFVQGSGQKEGTYTYVVKATSFQDTLRISEIYREFQLIVKDCPRQTNPTIFASRVGRPTVASGLRVCADSLIQLNVRGQSPGGTYQWRRNGVPIAGSTDSVFVIRNNQTGEYSVSVTNNKFCNSVVVSNNLAPFFVPKPTVSVAAASATGALCQGSSVRLTATSPTANLRHQWLRENVIIAGATNATFDAVESGSYAVRVTNSDGCPALSNTVNVISNTPPKAEITAPTRVVCPDKSVTLSATPGTGFTYAWTRDGQAITSTTSTVNISQAGSYAVKVTSSNGCSSTSTPFVLGQANDPTISINNPSGPQLCAGSSFTLTANGQNLRIYQWTRNGQNLNNETRNTLIINQAGDYALAATDANGCANTAASVKIELVNKITVILDSIPNFCGTTAPAVTLKATPAGGTFGGKGVVDGSFDPKTAGVGTHTITYNVTGNLACLTGSAQRTVTVAAVPVVSINSATGNQICTGDKVLVVGNVQNATIFQWFKDNVAITGAINNNYETSSAGRYRVEVSNVSGCRAISNDFTVEVFPRVTVVLDSIQSFCGTAFAAVALKGSPAGGTFSGKGVIGGSFDPKTAGVGSHTISYKVNGNLACLSGEAKRTVVITPPPVLNLGPDRDVYRGSSIKLNGDLGAGYSYQWTPPLGLDNPQSPKPIATLDESIVYRLRATGPNNCVAEDTIALRVVQVIYVPDVFTPNGDGINDVWEIKGLEAYPDAEISVYNRWGNVVYYGKTNNPKPFDGIFNDEPLATGLYVYAIKTNRNGYELRGKVLLMR